MPWISELPQRNARRLMRPGVSMTTPFWNDRHSPHEYLTEFPAAEDVLDVVFAANGWAFVTVRPRKGDGTPGQRIELHWSPAQPVAVVTYPGDDMGDRLILPGGYLHAHAGTGLRTWTVFEHRLGGHHTLHADGVTVAEGRKMLADLTT